MNKLHGTLYGFLLAPEQELKEAVRIDETVFHNICMKGAYHSVLDIPAEDLHSIKDAESGAVYYFDVKGEEKGKQKHSFLSVYLTHRIETACNIYGEVLIVAPDEDYLD